MANDGTAGKGVGNFHVPVAIVPDVLRLPNVVNVQVLSEDDYPYPKMDRSLNNVVSALQSGATAEQAVKSACIRHETKAWVLLWATDNDALASAKTWLGAREVYINPLGYIPADPPGTLFPYSTTSSLTALVPVSLILSLSQLDSVTRLTGGDCWHWQASNETPELLEYFRTITNDYLPPEQRPTPTPYPTVPATPAGGSDGPSGQAPSPGIFGPVPDPNWVDPDRDANL
ncbi:MAG: hypothetical protein F4W95_06730 [Chloroflexi bacterium]|nr:hypothetical protein [Chloroflexota bacterium]